MNASVVDSFESLLRTVSGWVTHLGVVSAHDLLKEAHWGRSPTLYFHGYYSYTRREDRTRSLLMYSSEGLFELTARLIDGQTVIYYTKRFFGQSFTVTPVLATHDDLVRFMQKPIRPTLH